MESSRDEVNQTMDGDDTSMYDETFYSAEEDNECTEKPSSVDVNTKGDEQSKGSCELLKTKDRSSDIFSSTSEKSPTSPKIRLTPLKKSIDSVTPNTRWYFPYVGTKTSPPGLCPFRKRKVRVEDSDDDDDSLERN
ncbi:14973_t:CDS:1, partial [Racocetra fulgida]